MNRYLTRILVPYDIVARPWKDGGFRDSYQWHRRIWECFPDDPSANRDFLTRLDDTGNGYRVLLLSSRVPRKPDWCPSAGWETKEISPGFLQHRSYSFSLLANPTRKLAAPRDAEGKRRNAKRVPISQREDLVAWMERKGTQHGFRIDPLRLQTVPRPRQLFLKSNQPGLHTATEFVGRLEVIDPAAFQEAFVTGIGSAKAFGFGMLMLSPV